MRCPNSKNYQLLIKHRCGSCYWNRKKWAVIVANVHNFKPSSMCPQIRKLGVIFKFAAGLRFCLYSIWKLDFMFPCLTMTPILLDAIVSTATVCIAAFKVWDKMLESSYFQQSSDYWRFRARVLNPVVHDISSLLGLIFYSCSWI